MKLNHTHALAAGLTAAALAVALLHTGALAQETADEPTSADVVDGAIDAAPSGRPPAPTRMPGRPTPMPTKDCCLAFRFDAGVLDNFAPGYAEPASPGLELAAWAANQPVTRPMEGFDDPSDDTWFLHTFVLPNGNCIRDATLTVRARANPGGSSNDAMHIGVENLTDAATGAWTVRTWAYFSAIFGSWPVNNPGPISINLGAVPSTFTGPTTNLIPDLNAARHLDVYIQDDTEVDGMTLGVTFCQCP